MKLRLTVLLVLLLGVVRCFVIHAAEKGLGRITIHDAIEIALANNRRILISQQQQVTAASDVGEARAAFLPRLDIVEGFNYTDKPTLVFSNLLDQASFKQRNFAVGSLNEPTPITNLSSQVRVEQPLYSGGRLSANLQQAKASADATQAQEIRTRHEVTVSVIDAYYRVLLAEANLQVVREALVAARGHIKRTRDLYEQGQSVKADFLRAQVFAGGLEREEIEAQNALAIERSRFLYRLGLKDATFTLSDPVSEDIGPIGRLDDLKVQAGRLRPDLRGAESEIEKSRAAVTATEADYYPSLGLVSQYESNTRKFTSSGESFAVFITARWNLFQGFATSEKITASKAQLKEAQLRFEDLAHAVSLEVEQAYLGLVAVRKQIEVANDNVRQAEESLGIVRDRYAAGLARNVDVLDGETALKKSEQDLLKAQVSSQILRAQLNLATGQLP